MTEFTDNYAVATLNYAPFETTVEWQQRALAHVIQRWQEERPKYHRKVIESGAYEATGYTITATTDTDALRTQWELKQDFAIDTQTYDPETEALTRKFTVQWFEELINTIRFDQNRSGFAPEEYVALAFTKNPHTTIHDLAETLNLSVDAAQWIVTGANHRVQNEIVAERHAVKFEHTGSADNQTYQPTVEQLVTAEQYPVGATN